MTREDPLGHPVTSLTRPPGGSPPGHRTGTLSRYRRDHSCPTSDSQTALSSPSGRLCGGQSSFQSLPRSSPLTVWSVSSSLFRSSVDDTGTSTWTSESCGPLRTESSLSSLSLFSHQGLYPPTSPRCSQTHCQPPTINLGSSRRRVIVGGRETLVGKG